MDLTGPVRITHQFHPLYGRPIEVVAHRTQWGDDLVFYRDAEGLRRSIPAHWTSLSPEDPYISLGAGKSPFRAQDLIELAALIENLRA